MLPSPGTHSAGVGAQEPGDPRRRRRDEAKGHDRFWDEAARSLAASRLRLLFVADEIPEPLKRVAEFLNAQIPGIEVFAVEVKRFRGEGAGACSARLRKVQTVQQWSRIGPVRVSGYCDRSSPQPAGSVRKQQIRSGLHAVWTKSGPKLPTHHCDLGLVVSE